MIKIVKKQWYTTRIIVDKSMINQLREKRIKSDRRKSEKAVRSEKEKRIHVGELRKKDNVRGWKR